jgi:hypothetical protein
MIVRLAGVIFSAGMSVISKAFKPDGFGQAASIKRPMSDEFFPYTRWTRA